MRFLPAHPGGTRRIGALHSFRFEADRQRSLRRKNQSVGSRRGAGSQSAGQCFVSSNIGSKLNSSVIKFI
jgi:hypothetical protein